MASGLPSGLRTNEQMREDDAEMRRAEAERLRKLDSSLSGQGAETRYREATKFKKKGEKRRRWGLPLSVGRPTFRTSLLLNRRHLC